MFKGKKKPDTMPAVTLTWLRRNWFLFGILTALLLGFLLPGIEPVLNRGGFARTLLIVLLFLISGFTLAVGVPLISTYFAATPEVLGIALLPLVFYHAWQLLVAGFVRNSRLVRITESY